MKIKTQTKKLLFILPLISVMTIAEADWGITLGADNEIKRYEDVKNDASLLLGIEYRGENLNIDKEAISYDFTHSKAYAIEAIAKSNNRGFEASDGKLFKDMKDRDSSIDIGVRGIIRSTYGPALVEVTRDVNASKGYEADLRFGGLYPHNKHWTGKGELSVSPFIGVKYQSDKVVDYHYGVRNNEATASRSAYKGKAATTPYVGVESQLNLSKRVSMQAALTYEKRDDVIKDSPLTNKKDSDILLNLGITYWF